MPIVNFLVLRNKSVFLYKMQNMRTIILKIVDTDEHNKNLLYPIRINIHAPPLL